MKKTLILMRHGEAENSSLAGDFTRKLTEAGKSGAGKSGAFLQGLGCAPQEILASPAARASQTADIAAQALGFAEAAIVRPRKLYNPTLEDILESVAGLHPQTDCALLVAHNPAISYALGHFCGTVKGFEPGSVAVIEFAIESWDETGRGEGKLIYFFEP